MTSKTQQSPYFKSGLEVESKILEKISGFLYNVNIVCYSQSILSQGENINIHTIQCGDFEQPPLVLLHGYGGSSLAFYKIIYELSQHFKVYTFDWPGMGLSDRWDFKLKQNSPGEVINFFVDIFENWRKAVGLQQFQIAAHSFGGYIASHYYYRFPNNIKNLFLLSPMGGTKKQQIITPPSDNNEQQQQQHEDKEEEAQEKESSSEGMINWVANYLSKNAKLNRYTPQSVLDKWYIPKNYILKKVVHSSLKNESQENKDLFVQYFQAIFNIPSCDDSYIHDLVDYPSLDPEISLEELFSSEEYINRSQDQKKNIYVLYGDSDFMDSQGCENLFHNQILQGDLFYLHNSSHGLMIDAPQQVLSIIFNPQKIFAQPYMDEKSDYLDHDKPCQVDTSSQDDLLEIQNFISIL